MKVLRTTALTVGLLLGTGGSAPAQYANNQCRYAVDSYNNAVNEISSRLRRYSSCVSNSQGGDDCSSEFSRLRSAQSDFEISVSGYQNYCR